MMELRQLRHFLAVAETLNFSRAAERLTMAASPLSRSIQQLEREVGGALFLRGTRRVELTPLGSALIPHAERTLRDVDVLSRDLRRRVSGSSEFHVGIRSVPSQLLRQVVDDVIRGGDPHAEVRIHPMESFAQIDGLISGRLSFGLLNRRSDDRRLGYLPVLREAAAVAMPDRPRYAELEVVRPDDLAALRLLLQPGTEGPSGPLEPYRQAAAEVEHVDFEIVGGLAAIIAEGGSCCFTLANPDAPWHRYLAGSGVVIRPLPPEVPRSETHLAWRIDRDVPADLGPMLARARARFPEPVEL